MEIKATDSITVVPQNIDDIIIINESKKKQLLRLQHLAEKFLELSEEFAKLTK